MQRLAAVLLALLVSSTPLVATAQTVPEQVPTETEVEATIATSTPEAVATEEVSTKPAITEPAGDYVPGEVLVKYKESRVDLEVAADQREAYETIQSLEMETQAVIEGMNIAVVEIPSDVSVGEAMAQLESQPDIEYVEPNYTRSIQVLASTSPELTNTWALQNLGQTVNSVMGTQGADIDALSAWDIASGTDVVVAVIDTGVDYTHTELASQMWDGSNCVSETGTTSWSCIHGYDFEYDTSDPRATSTGSTAAHGTHVSGIIAAAHNDAGAVGVAYGAKIMALRFNLDTASEIRAIDFAIHNGAKIINASYGGSTFSQAEYEALQRFQNSGGLFVASAGNDDTNNDATPLYPASYDLSNIVSVAATDSDDDLAFYSNYGASSVDLAAPGSNILSTIPLDGYAYKSGTSMSAPFVSGVAALLWSYDPTLTAAEVKQALLDGGDALPELASITVSGKRLNAYGSLALVQATTTAPAADTEAPVITLLGSNPMSLTAGDTFTDPGAEVTDNVDATTTIMGTGVVDTAAAGTYTLTYSATDTAGNVATSTTRSVVVAAAIVSGGGGGGGGSSSSSSSGNSRRGGGGGGGSSSTTVSKPKVAEPSVPRPLTTGPQVLGASTYVFTRDLSQGASGTDVSELQQTLARLGYYTGPISGYYGPLTASAVSAYQNAKGLTAVGRVGPQTRAALNGTGATSVATSSSTAATITLLQAQLQVLLARLAELQAQGR